MKTHFALTVISFLFAFSLSSCKQSSRNDNSNSELPVKGVHHYLIKSTR